MAYFDEFRDIEKVILDSPQVRQQALGGLLGGAPELQPQQPAPSLADTVGELTKLMDTAPKAEPQPVQQPLETKEEVNRKTLEEAARQGQTLQPPQSQFRVPNPVENQYVNELALYKALNELAPQGEEGNVLRNDTHTEADLLRQRAAAAGIDLTRWGADNSTARDMFQQIESNRARAILESTMPDGKYYKSADQYYQDTVYDLRALGYSRNQAERIASNKARRYQADRVGYLDAVYNTYGRDGNTTNSVGAQMLAAIGQENPALANFYGAFYGTPKDEYNTQKDLARDAIQQGYRMQQLDFTDQGAMRRLIAQIAGNELGRQNEWNIEQKRMALNDNYRKDMAVFNSGVALKEYATKAGIDEEFAKKAQSRLEELKKNQPGEVEKYYDTLYNTALKMGYSEEQAAEMAKNFVLMKLTKDTAPAATKSSQSGETKMTAAQQEKVNRADNLVRAAFNSHSDEDIQALENYLNGDGLDEKGVGMDFAPATYQMYSDILLALKGYQCKLKNDDDGATAYWSQIKDVNILENMYRNENFDYYWERRGGKPK